MVKRALITRVTGQDDSYLAEFLLNKGYEVHGIIRRASTFNTHRIEHLYVDPHVPDATLFLHYGELMDGFRLSGLPVSLSHLQTSALDGPLSRRLGGANLDLDGCVPKAQRAIENVVNGCLATY